VPPPKRQEQKYQEEKIKAIPEPQNLFGEVNGNGETGSYLNKDQTLRIENENQK